MAKIEQFLERIQDKELREELSAAIKQIKEKTKFGLVFEEHLPELLRLPDLPIRKGALVSRKEDGNDLWTVSSIKSSKAVCRRDDEAGPHEQTFSIEELVVVKRFGDAIYPSLVPVDKIERAKEKPFHLLIQADNFHALQLLTYTHESKFDIIYIDPPYNTGARDWKYNNNYVDANDRWRHSKWLSFMKRRLVIAKRLLRPDGILVVTIDDWETHHLQMLLEQTLPEFELTNVVIEHNPRGSPSNNFTYCHEYATFMIPKGKAIIGQDLLVDEDTRNLRRAGKASRRKERKSMFYPILVKKGKVIGFGKPAADSFHPSRRNVKRKDGVIEVWPLDNKGLERRWHFGLDTVVDEIKRIQVRESEEGEIQLYVTKDSSRYKTVWTGSELDAAKYGTTLVADIVGTEFPFPKSLYATKRCLETVVSDRKEALILDFFAGSGTTLHATALINAQDNGRRQCVLITNNEVGEKEEKQLLKRGLAPGNPEWEANGICKAVAWPRCKYSVQGHRDDGSKLPGKYLNGEELKSGLAENIQYFELKFLDPTAVALGEEFQAILPILWIMAGAAGALELSKGSTHWFIPKKNPFAVLIRESKFADFCEAIKQREDITHVFLITNSEDSFQEMTQALPRRLKTSMLYKSYLDNFRLNTMKTT